VVRKAEESKSEIIRRHYDSGYSVKEIREMTGCSDSLIRIVIRNLNKKREKNSAKEGKARFNSPRSRLINDLFQVKKALDVIEKKNPKADWDDKKAFWKTMKKQYGDATSQVMDELVDPKPLFGEIASDLVNHPPHYKTGGVETIDFIEAKDLNYRLGNVVKYVSRAGKKNSDPVQDLEKAAWYLQREIAARKSA
jgi:transposase